ncbi:MAG: hypothetical protein H6740_04280 [Alphaproteobacteria bacterium]|nr:hypothetical protein [Alphaproteobacteria bacterium]
MLSALLLLACQGNQTAGPLADIDARYADIVRDLAVAERDTARNVRNKEARRRMVAAEQTQVAFFSDPKVRATIDEVRQSADPVSAWKAEQYWRQALLTRSWTEGEKAREAELLASIEEQRTQDARWQGPDGQTEISLSGRWPSVSEDADKLSPEERQSLLEAWVDHRTAWQGAELAELVALRNEVARREGFDSYWELAIAHRGLDPDEVRGLLDELEALVIPLNEARSGPMNAKAEELGLTHSFATAPLLMRAAGLQPDHADADAWFDTERVEEVLAEAFEAIGAPIDGLQIYVGPSRYTRPGAYGFAIRPPEHAAIVVSNDTRWSMWPYEALMHEGGRATWWRHISDDSAASPVLWEPPAPWFEGYGQIFDRMLYEPAFLERYVPELPAESREQLRTYRVQDTVDVLTWYLGATRAEQALYERPGQLKEVAAEAAAMERRLRAWSYDGPVNSEGLPYTSFLQSGIMLNYPGYVQNFLFAHVTEAILWDAASAAIGDPVNNAGLMPWLAENLVHQVGPETSFPVVLDKLNGGAPRTQALSKYLGK